MNKLFVSNWVTLDGIFSGPNGETEWFSFDKELDNYNLDILEKANTIVMGRKTFQMMEEFWPTEPAYEQYPRAAEYMNGASKHIFSKTVESSSWSNCFFYKDITRDHIQSIKSAVQGDVVVLGSSDIAMRLHQLNLIDQYNIILDPQVGMKGKSFFHSIDETKLELIESKAFTCGVIYLKYKVCR